MTFQTRFKKTKKMKIYSQVVQVGQVHPENNRALDFIRSRLGGSV